MQEKWDNESRKIGKVNLLLPLKGTEGNQISLAINYYKQYVVFCLRLLEPSSDSSKETLKEYLPHAAWAIQMGTLCPFWRSSSRQAQSNS